jgi:hypothetical protein
MPAPAISVAAERAGPAQLRTPMTTPATSADFLDGVVASVRYALAALDREDADCAEPPADWPDRNRAMASALDRLESNLAGWQAILGTMADEVRASQDDLATLDADLRRSLDAFAALRKHLQGTWHEAATGPES